MCVCNVIIVMIATFTHLINRYTVHSAILLLMLLMFQQTVFFTQINHIIVQFNRIKRDNIYKMQYKHVYSPIHLNTIRHKQHLTKYFPIK